ncbi:hypothetical protein H632_c2939p1 [Helicosporidium sp. ATCC 50920]|nr:hypothetical protein H632_c2939p1 [Helicosporidium sp. ATCC 50920]|eukprot:KDD72753.1 hypothetical protein H632_c2939p1 [Helicosporidium sp. ATCC 50920]
MSGPGGRVSRLFNGSARSSEGLGPESSEESRAEGSAKSEHGLLGAAGQEEGAAMPKPKVSFVEAKAGGARRTSGMLNAKPQRMSLLGTRNSLFIPPPVSEESLADENGMV